jgi:hypothetical protein
MQEQEILQLNGFVASGMASRLINTGMGYAACREFQVMLLPPSPALCGMAPIKGHTSDAGLSFELLK